MLTNCDNFRDMGGIKTHDGHVLKEKKIIRSGKLSDLNDDDDDDQRFPRFVRHRADPVGEQ